MKILVTGSNGFIGRNLSKKLHRHDVCSISRKEVDLCNTDEVNDFFKGKFFDVVIHTAISGGRRNKEDGPEILQNNLLMFFNLMKNLDKFEKFINISSGAELEKSKVNNGKLCLDYSFPTDPYGMSKNIISRISVGFVRFCNIRGYGVFGEDESLERFIRSNVIRAINNEDIIVHQDKIMDFFYIDDFVSLVEKIMSLKVLPREIDCSYEDVYYLSDIGQMIKEVCNSESRVIVQKSGLGTDYFGKSSIYTDTLNCYGLVEGIRRIYLNEKHNFYN